jgi:hypothetical protein
MQKITEMRETSQKSFDSSVLSTTPIIVESEELHDSITSLFMNVKTWSKHMSSWSNSENVLQEYEKIRKMDSIDVIHDL